MELEISPMEDYKKRERRLNKRLEDLGDRKNAPETLRKLSKKARRDEERETDIELARRVFSEALEEYQEGEYDWEDFVDELEESLRAIK